MIFKQQKPISELSAVIDFIWWMETDSSKFRATAETIFPDAASEIIFHFKESFHRIINNNVVKEPPLLFIGQTTQPYSIFPPNNIQMMGVRLFPYASKYLFNVNASVLTDKFFDLNRIWSGAGMVFKELARENTFELKSEILQSYLLGLLHRADMAKLDRAKPWFDQFRLLDGRMDLTQARRHAFLGKRAFEKNCYKQTGITPKKLSDIFRFQNILKELLSEDCSINKTKIAYKYDYCDQAHFIRSFKKYTNATPSEIEKSMLLFTRPFLL
jgi:AraC-like DNA-binding protein